MSERCEFRFDPTEAPGEPEEIVDDLPTTAEGVWRCPRKQRASSSYCRVHAPDATDSDIQRAICDALQQDQSDHLAVASEQHAGHDQTRFLGVEMEELNLSHRVFAGGHGSQLDLRGSKIGTLVLDRVRLPVDCRLDGSHIGTISMTEAVIEGAVHCRAATIAGSVNMNGVRTEGPVKFRHAEINADIDVARAHVDGRLDFGFAQISGELTAGKADCRGRFTLKEADVSSVSAANIVVDGVDPESSIPGLQFRGLTVHEELSIQGCQVEGTLIGHDLTVNGSFDGSESSIRDDVILGSKDGATALDEPTLDGLVDFSEATIGRELRLAGDKQTEDPLVGGPLLLEDARIGIAKLAPRIGDQSLQTVVLREAQIDDGFLGQPADDQQLYYDLANTTLGTVDLVCDRSPNDCFWIDRTGFDGFRFEMNRHKFAAENWRLDQPSEALQESVAISRTYRPAMDLAVDWLVTMQELPETRRWVQRTDQITPEACAEVAFKDLGEDEIARIAKNGPESGGVVGEALFARERYRQGVITYLAREATETTTELSQLFAEAGAELMAVAQTVATAEGSVSRTGTAVKSLAVAFAQVLADKRSITPDLNQRQTTYIKARKGADAVGDTVAVANFFVRELRIRRQEHAYLIRNADRTVRQMQAIGDYVWNLFFDVLAGYGERPGNVVAASVLVISVYSVLFYSLHRILDGFDAAAYAGIDGAVLLSIESFTSIVLGGTSVEPWGVRLLASVCGFTGAFLIALFVFTLTRSLNR